MDEKMEEECLTFEVEICDANEPEETNSVSELVVEKIEGEKPKTRRINTPKRRSIRKADPESWKQTIRKRLRQSGQEYVNAHGKVMGEKSLRPGCGDTCYLKCSEKFSQEQREGVHKAFWKLTDEQKNYFYWKYTSRVKPKRRRKNVDGTSKRAYTFLYRFEVRGEMISVCSKFFFATLDITARRIYYFYEHCFDTESSMPRAETRRGKFIRPPLPDLDERLNVIREHISSFPSVRLSGSSQKRYLSADLCLASMFRLYVDSTQDPLKQHWYSKVFYEEYNLGFRSASKCKKKCLAKIKTEKIDTPDPNAHISHQDADSETVTVSILPPTPPPPNKIEITENVEIYPVTVVQVSTFNEDQKQWNDGIQNEWVLTTM